MIRLALKNLWSQRRVYGWLVIELIILSILAWVIIDPTAVRLYYASRPIGYDIDRLAEINIATRGANSLGYSEEAADSAAVSANFDRILSIVNSWPGVESSTVVAYEPDGGGAWNTEVSTETDSVSANAVLYLQGTPFFTTYGIKPLDGQTIERIEALSNSPNDIVVSESTARRLRKTPAEAFGLELGKLEDRMRIVGVVNDIRTQSVAPNNTNLFFSQSKEEIGIDNFCLVVRLKDGIDPARFIDENRQTLQEKLSVGNYTPQSMRAYTAKSKSLQYTFGYTNSNRLSFFLAAFFLINMALGVVGTVWLQTRRRSSEAGVMKAFGARPSHIVATLIWEGVILTVGTWIIGSLIYLQYAIRNGLAVSEFAQNQDYPSSWVTDFWPHFITIALIILALMLVAVVIGIWIPARRIARVDPALSLKDE